MATIEVKLFQSTDTGAPVLDGFTAGGMLALLDACLVTGFNVQGPSGITRVGDVATVTFASPHGYGDNDVVLLSGADQTEYNGEFRISNISSGSFDITVSGSPTTPATGTLSAKRASLNWTKPHTGTSKAAFRNDSVAGSGSYLRVDNTSARWPKIRGYETMTDVDTGTGLFPTAAQIANGLVWPASHTADATARRWALAGDRRAFYLFVETGATAGMFQIHAFGDHESYKVGDLYSAIAAGAPTESYTYGGSALGALDKLTTTGCYIARAYNQIGSAVVFARFGSYASATLGSAGEAYPSPVDGGMQVSPIFVYESSATRGYLPGIYQPIHPQPGVHGDVIAGVAGLSGRNLFLAAPCVNATSGVTGRAAIDITGPWR